MEEKVKIPPEWLAEFEAAARRPLEQRMRYAFIKTYRPVMDDVKYRSFDTMEEYRQWCKRELPGLVGLWPHLNIAKRRKFAMRSIRTVADTCLLGNRAQFF